MKKKNFVSLFFGTVGGILFALGMCMCLLPEWGAFTPGVVIAAVGAAVLLVLLLVRRKMAGKPAVHISGKAVGAVLLGIVGALVLGVGMCMAMVWSMLVPGIVMGVAGILLSGTVYGSPKEIPHWKNSYCLPSISRKMSLCVSRKLGSR